MVTLFTRIITSEIPSFKIYENEYVYAFLDIFPQQPGHTLIVPKCEIDHFSDVGEPYYSAIFQAAKKISKAIQKATGCKRVCAMFIGYEIPHCHYQLIPTNSIEDTVLQKKPQGDMTELEEMRKKIVEALEK